jgi:pimeloyl-ACP methyl ester carboxylesterase
MSTWILLRGLTRERRHWGSFPLLLQRAIGDGTVLPLDLPGNGSLNREASPRSVEAMARWCSGELARRGLPPPFHVLAMSLGAMVTVAWAHARPEELRAAVLINTSLRPFSPLHQRLRPSACPSLLRLAAIGADAAAREDIILRLTSNNADAAAAVRGDWADFARQNPVSRANAFRQLWAAARYRAPLEAPAVSILFVASAGDRLVAPECSRALAHRWRCPIVEHPSAGHDLPLDDGPWLVRELGAWLGQQARKQQA